MPRVGFEPTIAMSERVKTFHALDCAAGHCDRPILLKWILNEWSGRAWNRFNWLMMGSSVAGSCEHSNDEYGEFCEWVSN
jgi:hypothetical protein